jgi:hypothetical protein
MDKFVIAFTELLHLKPAASLKRHIQRPSGELGKKTPNRLLVTAD